MQQLLLTVDELAAYEWMTEWTVFKFSSLRDALKEFWAVQNKNNNNQDDDYYFTAQQVRKLYASSWNASVVKNHFKYIIFLFLLLWPKNQFFEQPK